MVALADRLRPPRPALPTGNAVGRGDALAPWLRAQAINVARHAAALRPFRKGEFGTAPAAPSDGHLQVVNELLASLRVKLMAMTREVTDVARVSAEAPSVEN